MTLYGWLLMLGSWLLILGLMTFCFRRIIGEKNKDDDSVKPADPGDVTKRSQ